MIRCRQTTSGYEIIQMLMLDLNQGMKYIVTSTEPLANTTCITMHPTREKDLR